MAIQEGIFAVFAVPLQPMGEAIGTLNVYSSKASCLDDSHVEIASLFAQQAAVVLANSMAYSSAQMANGQLRVALESRELIGQAQGILMAREGCSPDAAFDLLREVSQRTNRKLRDVALDVVSAIQRGDQPLRG
jgi:GAF domain-containing protein